MTLVQLTYFAAVARTGSLTAAASELNVSQPTVSEQVRRLERLLGVDLFIRIGRGVRLTDGGRVFLSAASQVLEAARAAEMSIDELSELKLGNLSVGFFGQAYLCDLTEVIFEFHKAFPGVKQKIVEKNSAEIADCVREGLLEAGVVCLPIEATGLTVQPFYRDPILYVSADSSKTAKAKSIEEFCQADLILYDSSSAAMDPTRRHLNQAAQRLGLTIQPLIDIEDIGTALELTRRGVGDTIASERLLERFGIDGLCSVAFEDPVTEEFAVVHRVGSRLGPANRHFLELFINHMRPRA